MVQTPWSRSISVHAAPRTSPERIRRPYHLQNRRHLAMRRRLHMPYAVSLRSEHRADPVAGVVGPEIHRHGPFQYSADALAQLPGRGGPVVPDRSKDADHVRGRQLRNWHVTDAGEGVPFQAGQPELRMLGRAPSRPQLLPNLPGRLREGGQRLGPTLPGQRIASLAGQASGSRTPSPGLPSAIPGGIRRARAQFGGRGW